MRDDVAEIVGHDQHCDAGCCERAQRREERIAFARRERGGRLVEDQRRRFAREFAQNFDALHRADVESFEPRVGIDGKRVRAREAAHFAARGLRIETEGAARFAAEHDVLPDAHAFDDVRVLWNEPHGSIGPNRSFARAQAARCDRSQRRLARAVLAAQRVNFAGAHVEVDAVERAHPPGYVLAMPRRSSERRLRAFPV